MNMKYTAIENYFRKDRDAEATVLEAAGAGTDGQIISPSRFFGKTSPKKCFPNFFLFLPEKIRLWQQKRELMVKLSHLPDGAEHAIHPLTTH